MVSFASKEHLVLFALVAILYISAVSAQSKNCSTDKKVCEKDECCVRVTDFIGKCKKLKLEEENCSTKVLKQPLKDHVYLEECPCGRELKCVKQEGGLIGADLGTCQRSRQQSQSQSGSQESND